MKSKANHFIKVRAEMRRTFFYLRSSLPSLPDDSHTPDHQAAPDTLKHQAATDTPNHQAAPRHTTTTPHHANGEGGEPPHALTLTTSTDRHTLDRFRASDGRTLAPVWMASRPELCALNASRTPSPRLGVRQNISTSFALPSPYQWV